jgi:hypothetical protein
MVSDLRQKDCRLKGRSISLKFWNRGCFRFEIIPLVKRRSGTQARGQRYPRRVRRLIFNACGASDSPGRLFPRLLRTITQPESRGRCATLTTGRPVVAQAPSNLNAGLPFEPNKSFIFNNTFVKEPNPTAAPTVASQATSAARLSSRVECPRHWATIAVNASIAALFHSARRWPLFRSAG